MPGLGFGHPRRAMSFVLRTPAFRARTHSLCYGNLDMHGTRVLILGANGQTGRQIAQLACQAGLHVRGLVRKQPGADDALPDVDYVIGDSTRPGDVMHAIEGCDSVVMALGHPQKWNSVFVPPPDNKHLLEESARTLIEAMQQSGVRRLVAMSAAGAGASISQVPGWMKLMIRMTALSAQYSDHTAQERVITDSSVDWTIVKPARLLNEPVFGQLAVINDGSKQPANTISRCSVARFCVEALTANSYVRRSPLISEIE